MWKFSFFPLNITILLTRWREFFSSEKLPLCLEVQIRQDWVLNLWQWPTLTLYLESISSFSSSSSSLSFLPSSFLPSCCHMCSAARAYWRRVRENLVWVRMARTARQDARRSGKGDAEHTRLKEDSLYWRGTCKEMFLGTYQNMDMTKSSHGKG